MTGCEELDFLLEQNGTYDQIQHLRITMETDNGKTEVLKRSFDKVCGGMYSKIREILAFNKTRKEIEVARGDISKIKDIDITLKLLKLFEKSKDAKYKKYTAMLDSFYKNILRFKTQFMESYQRRGSYSGDFVYALFIVSAEMFIEGASHMVSIHSGQMKSSGLLDKRIPEMLKAYSNGSVQKWCDFFLSKNKETLKEDGVFLFLGLVTLCAIVSFAFMLRVMVFYYYYHRTNLAEHFEHQSNYLSLQAAEVGKSGSMDKNKKKSIEEAQKKWAARLMKLSNFFAVADIEAAKKAAEEEKAVNKDINPESIDVPNSGMDFF